MHEDISEQGLSLLSKSILELQQMFLTQYGVSIHVECHHKSCGGMQVILLYPLE